MGKKITGFGLFKGEKWLLVCNTRERAEELLQYYPDHYIAEVEEVNREWVKKDPPS